MKEIIKQALQLQITEGKGYERTICGGIAEDSSSTIEMSDVDVNARFYIENNMIGVKPSDKFLYHVIVPKEKKMYMDDKVLLMQQHPLNLNENGEFQIKGKGIEKSCVENRKEGILYLSSHVARWQLIGVI